MKTSMLAAAFAALASFGTMAVAQQPATQQNDQRTLQNQNQQQQRTEQLGQRDSHGTTPVVQYFAGKLMLMNESMMQLNQLAQQKASSEEVKTFAEKMNKEHQQLSQKLQECAPEIAKLTELSGTQRHAVGFRGTDGNTATDGQEGLNRENNNRSDRLNQDQPGSTNENLRNDNLRDQRRTDDRLDGERAGASAERSETTLTASSQDGGDHVVRQILNVDRKAAEGYTQASTRMLQQYQGQDFDMGYLGFQIASHTIAVSELKAMDSVGDEKFQQVVQQASRSMEQHLQEAKQLAKKFEDDRSSRSTGQRNSEQPGGNR
jgi:predicted outer membrane protein